MKKTIFLLLSCLTVMLSPLAKADTMLILNAASAFNYDPSIAQYFIGQGQTVTEINGNLPASLTGYDQVWVFGDRTLTTSERSTLTSYLAAGGAVFIQSEVGCCNNAAATAKLVMQDNVKPALLGPTFDHSVNMTGNYPMSTPNPAVVGGASCIVQPANQAHAYRDTTGIPARNQLYGQPNGSDNTIVAIFTGADLTGNSGALMINGDFNDITYLGVRSDPQLQIFFNALKSVAAQGGVCGPLGTPKITVSKTPNTTTLTPGGTIVYTVTVSNTGTAAASSVAISDPLPSGISAFNWTCAAAGGATCPAATGTGAISATITSLPASGVLTYTVTATVSATPPANVSNVVSVTPASPGVCSNGAAPDSAPPCTASTITPPLPQIRVVKTTTSTVLNPGGTAVYSIAVSNESNAAATNVTISDPLSANFSAFSWTCAATGTAICPAAAGSGSLNQTASTLPANSALTYTVTATIALAPVASIANTATVNTGNGVCLPLNTPMPCTSTSTQPSAPRLQTAKTVSPTNVTPGAQIQYTLTVSNLGASDASLLSISDPLPAGISSYDSWSCTSAPTTGLCPNASGTGAVSEVAALLPVGNSITYAINATVSQNPPPIIANIANITSGSGSVCVPDNAVGACTPSTTSSVTFASIPVPIPAWVAFLMAAALFVAGSFARRWRSA